MFDQQENTIFPTEEIVRQETPEPLETNPPLEPETVASPNGFDEEPWHARAGREGARRVHELIQEGRLYEQEHGLKRGRQRLRQLIELGKIYEQEHGLRRGPTKKRRQRLSRLGRQELMTTLLECLLRIAKPSFRSELSRLVATLEQERDDHAA